VGTNRFTLCSSPKRLVLNALQLWDRKRRGGEAGGMVKPKNRSFVVNLKKQMETYNSPYKPVGICPDLLKPNPKRYSSEWAIEKMQRVSSAGGRF
tara:strand:- start:56 stop:340 length:285 start_codon:yes stop_codon:yes gene_type:complete